MTDNDLTAKDVLTESLVWRCRTCFGPNPGLKSVEIKHLAPVQLSSNPFLMTKEKLLKLWSERGGERHPLQRMLREWAHVEKPSALLIHQIENYFEPVDGFNAFLIDLDDSKIAEFLIDTIELSPEEIRAATREVYLTKWRATRDNKDGFVLWNQLITATAPAEAMALIKLNYLFTTLNPKELN